MHVDVFLCSDARPPHLKTHNWQLLGGEKHSGDMKNTTSATLVSTIKWYRSSKYLVAIISSLVSSHVDVLEF